MSILHGSFVLEGLWLQKMLPGGAVCVQLETFHKLHRDCRKWHSTLGLQAKKKKKKQS